MAERRSDDLRGAVNGLRADPDSRQTFLIGDQAPALYSIVRNPALASALRLLQKEGRDAFYKGAIADAIVAKVKAGRGVMTKEDLAEFESEWVEPISTNYHGYDIFQLPPPGQGFAALEMLNILEVCVPKLGSISPCLDRQTRCSGTSRSKQRNSRTRIFWQRMPTRNSQTCRSKNCCPRNTRRSFVTRSIPTKHRRPGRPQKCRAERSTSRPPIAGATWCPLFTACSASTAAALPCRPTDSSCTIGAARSLSIQKAQRRRAPKAAVPQHHRRFHPKGRAADHDIRQYGRERSA